MCHFEIFTKKYRIGLYQNIYLQGHYIRITGKNVFFDEPWKCRKRKPWATRRLIYPNHLLILFFTCKVQPIRHFLSCSPLLRALFNHGGTRGGGCPPCPPESATGLDPSFTNGSSSRDSSATLFGLPTNNWFPLPSLSLCLALSLFQSLSFSLPVSVFVLVFHYISIFLFLI